MNKKSSVSFGPGASSLILIFVMLAMSVLGMLALMNSRNDIRLSERSVQVTQAVYVLNAKAEERRAQLDALLLDRAQAAQSDEDYLNALSEALPEGVSLEGDLLSWEETDDVRTLQCALRVQPLGSEARTKWARHSLMAQTGDDWEDFTPDWGSSWEPDMEDEWEEAWDND